MPHYIPTCENAVSTVPEWHRAVFQGHEERVTSSEGWSPGALNLAQGIAMKLHTPLVHAEVTRLLIDLGRHPKDDERWSTWSHKLTEEQREKLDLRVKEPYLQAIITRVEDAQKRGDEVIHLSLDTDPEALPGTLEFQYDARRNSEGECVAEWSRGLQNALPDLIIRRSSPPSRSLSSYLRRKFPDLGSIRLSVAQSAFLTGQPIPWMKLKKAITDTLPR